MMLNILQWTGQLPEQRISLSQMSIMMQLRNKFRASDDYFIRILYIKIDDIQTFCNLGLIQLNILVHYWKLSVCELYLWEY